MNFQEKLFERLPSCGNAPRPSPQRHWQARAPGGRRRQARRAAQRVRCRAEQAGREFNKVARRHAIRFVKQNSTLAAQVRDDVSALAARPSRR
jgi:hypothetical protein